MRNLIICLFLANFGFHGAYAASRARAGEITPLYLVNPDNQASYGGGNFSSYLSFLTLEQRELLKFIMITPDCVKIVKRGEDSLFFPVLSPDRAKLVCNLLADRSEKFRKRLLEWHTARWIGNPDLVQLARQLRPGKRPYGDE